MKSLDKARIYHAYPRYFTSTGVTRKKIVILGSGWSSLYLTKNLSPKLYDVHIVSPRDHFVFTPLLPKVSSGMIHSSTCAEPVVNFLPSQSNFYHGRCDHVDVNNKLVKVVPVDSPRAHFTLSYDVLVMALGARTNSFGIPGVYENALFLKEIEHARAIFKQVINCALAANLPNISKQDRQRLLHVIIVGGGPTGVEVAGEINWLFKSHFKYSFPHLIKDAKVTIIEGGQKLLPSFGSRNSSYALKKFTSSGINIMLQNSVTEIHSDGVTLKDFQGNISRLHANTVVWASGLQGTELAMDFCKQLEAQNSPRGILVDGNLKVLGVGNSDIYALGDCAKIVPPSLEENRDAVSRLVGGDTVDAFLKNIKALYPIYPQVHCLKHKAHAVAFRQFLKDHAGSDKNAISLQETLRWFDRNYTPPFPTAQVAKQQGLYLARLLNSKESGPFLEDWRGSMASLGGRNVVGNFPWGQLNGTTLARALWYFVYLTMLSNWRMRLYFFLDVIFQAIFKRCISSN
ncbi:bifunctional FAD-NAD(P)-binding domain/FAD-NAD(P)-binding domain superfamily/Alternative NADH dehydrogenase [Babesia duncani]|uniref:NADH:ubiquinone reductase (non-electrogenic) n=1 Tax=Babesia duncani TaxID=323732 RepID=A0AAD9UNK9_9APIC|nr:bifunctional FAD-NAD(P)-binding domain/FAD-NAD(P)-binding domain superfamily/Alternative NADH dehydrogenase [Babesia duncani]